MGRRFTRLDALLVALPWLLFAVPFQLARPRLVEAMSAVSILLALGVLATGRASISLKGIRWVPYSLGSAVALYLVFLAGGVFARTTGMWWQVEAVYSSVRPGALQLAGVFFLGLAEEVYWRGYVQGYVVKRVLGKGWWLSTVPYSLVHFVSGMPLLILAAIPVGLIFGLVAERAGVVASGLGHSLWLYLVLYVLPVTVVLS
ncbi:CPBP family intramembrane metalloprotease [Infirmifilum lucidum]|uniref:CPBP family intramembrane metalloprotease n=1 Tax=Infirmifilum lucidum TaxID=2776706 RepID=A0A7L9FJ38_9CREN|nr:CPBP family intramembrane glutamic endopeptidase [Infirmifilum lucidum]QOJ78916.1 CPBP family intramembrane metalloprotease [Infirmifilum lucidum]